MVYNLLYHCPLWLTIGYYITMWWWGLKLHEKDKVNHRKKGPALTIYKGMILGVFACKLKLSNTSCSLLLLIHSIQFLQQSLKMPYDILGHWIFFGQCRRQEGGRETLS